MEKYKNKRMVVRKGGRYARLTAEDVGIGGVCPVCRHFLLRHYDGDPKEEFIDPRLFRYRCFTCEPETEQEKAANAAKVEAQQVSFTKIFTNLAEKYNQEHPEAAQ
jgi:hypothetical protein